MKKLFFTAVAVLAFSFPSGASFSIVTSSIKIEYEVYSECIDEAFLWDDKYGPLSYKDFDLLVRLCEFRKRNQ